MTKVDEVKYLDMQATQALTAPTDSSGGEITPDAGCTGAWNVPANGSGDQQRDGRKIRMLSLHFKGTISGSVTTGNASFPATAAYYLAVVLNKQTNGNLLNSEDVFTNTLGTEIGNVSLMRNRDYISTFRVLHQVKVARPQLSSFNDASSTGTVGGFIIPFEMYVKLNMDVNCKGTTADVASVVDNSIALIGFATNTVGAPTVNVNARMRFVG